MCSDWWYATTTDEVFDMKFKYYCPRCGAEFWKLDYFTERLETIASCCKCTFNVVLEDIFKKGKKGGKDVGILRLCW